MKCTGIGMVATVKEMKPKDLCFGFIESVDWSKSSEGMAFNERGNLLK